MVTFENGDFVPSQGRGRFLKIVYSTTTDHSISSITKHVLPRDYKLHMHEVYRHGFFHNMSPLLSIGVLQHKNKS